MKPLSQCKLCRLMAEKGRSLASVQVKGRYQTELGLSRGEDDPSPLCSHRWNGSFSHPLWRLLVILSLLTLTLGALRALWGIFSRLFR